MKTMGKKLVAVLLAVTLIASLALPVTAAEPTVVNVTAKMTEPLYEELDASYWCDHSNLENTDWESHWYFETYNVYAKTLFTLHFSDGTTKEIAYNSADYNKYIDRCDISFNGNYCSEPYVAGNTYEAVINPQVYVKYPVCKEFETTLSITVEENPISNVKVELSNNINEDWASSYLDGDSATFYDYYDVNKANPVITVEYTNGTEFSGTVYEIQEKYNTYVEIIHNQSINNIWLAGNTYDVTFKVLGYECTVPVTIISDEIKSIEVNATKPLIENISGYTSEYFYRDDELQQDVSFGFFEYDVSSAGIEYTITYESGAVVTTDYIPGEHGIYITTTQVTYSDEKQAYVAWTVGNTYTAKLVSYDETEIVWDTFEVEIIKNPVENIVVEATSVLQKQNGHWTDEYGSWYDTPTENSYWGYNVSDSNPVITISYNDGTPDLVCTLDDIEKKTGYAASCGSTQSKDTPWEIGTENTAYIDFMGQRVYFNVTVVEWLIKDVTLAEPITFFENPSGWYNEWDINARLNVILWNDEVATVTAGRDEDITGLGRVTFSTNQYEAPWTVDGENEFTINISNSYGYAGAPFEIVTSVVIKENTTNYWLELYDGEFIITGIKNMPQDGILTFPEEIEGYPVTGLDLYNYADAKLVKEIVIPDSVKTISAYSFSGFENLEKVTIGSGVKEFDASLFAYNTKLLSIEVSEDNENMCDVDGIVYNSAKNKVLAVPLGIKSMIMFPSTVTDVSVLTDNTFYSSVKFGFEASNGSYVTVDGVTYTADMKTVVSCDPTKSGKVTLADTVEALGTGAFSGCSRITEVTLPNTIDTIVYAAFHDCTALVDINIPSTVTSIEEAAFANCHSLTEVDLPSGLTYLGNMAFINSGLNDVVIPDGLNTIGYKAFANSSVASVDLGTGVMFLDSAFKGCYNLESIFIPKSVLHFGTAFAYCEKLKNVTLEDGLEDISAFAFMNCDSLESIVIPDSVTRVGAEAFEYCDSLESVVLGDGVISIGEKAFMGSPVSKKLEFGENVSYLDQYAFAESNMTSVVIPNTVTEVTYAAFLDSSKLADITLPENVEVVGQHAFDGTAWYKNQTNGLTYLGDVLYRYKGDVTEPTKVTIKEGTRLIANGAFENLDPYWWPGVGEYYDLSGITEITFPSTLEKIGEYAFLDMYNVEKVNLGKATTDAEELDFAFWYLHGLEKITVSADNEKYATVDGVLYTKDLTTLVYVPRAKTGNLIVPETVTTIANPIGVCGLESITFLGDNVDVNPDNIYYDAGIKLYCIAGTQTEENISEWDYDYETVARMESSNPDVDISVTESETGAIPEGSTIEVTDLTSEVPAEEKQVVYDITIMNAGEPVQPNAPVTVSLPAPVEFVAEKCNVFRLEDDGTRTYMDAEYRDGRFYFTTDHFSKYVIEQITHTLGDVNEDDKTTLSDVVTLARYIADWENIDYQTVALDINGDGVVNLIDVTVLAQYVAEWEGVEISTKPYIEQ